MSLTSDRPAHEGGKAMTLGRQSRRKFLGKFAFGITGAGIAPAVLKGPLAVAAGEVPYRTLGRSGEKVSLVGLGGFHIGGERDEQESIRLIPPAIDKGINFLDKCWGYPHRGSEIPKGQGAQGGHRPKS